MDLVDLAPSLQRAVAPPGEFDTYFPDTQASDLAGSLADGLAEVQMDGLLGSITLDPIALTATPDLTPAQQALVVLYARARIVASRLANIKTMTRYKAGPVEAETAMAASILTEILKDTSARKRQILEDAKTAGLATTFTMVDMFVSKSIDFSNPDVRYLYPVEMIEPRYPR